MATFKEILKKFPQWVVREEKRNDGAGGEQTVIVRNPEAANWAKTPEALAAVREVAGLCERANAAVKAANVPPNRDRELANAWASVSGMASSGRTDVDALHIYLTHVPVLAKLDVEKAQPSVTEGLEDAPKASHKKRW